METVNADFNTVRNMYFVGRNYLKHIEELNNEKPDQPLIFTKPVSSLCKDGVLQYPSHSTSVHFEGEMVFMIPEDDFSLEAGATVLAGCGLDFTARDVQDVAKKKGLPWFGAKCFKGSAVLSEKWVKLTVDELKSLEVKTLINGEQRQKGSYTQKMFTLEEIFEFIGKTMTFEKGDVVFTGTPVGVGEVFPGDRIEVQLLKDGEIVSTAKCEVQ